jgi:hypothetical protein
MDNIITPVITEKIKGIIYKLYDKNDETKFYIGSSTMSLYTRTYQHKYNSKKGTNKLYKYIRDNGEIENFIGEVLETIEVENIKELRHKEQDFINLLKPSLNSNNATTNINDAKKLKKIYMRTYDQTEGRKNKRKIRSQTQEYKNYHKDYYTINIQKYKDYYKDYYQSHKKDKLIIV